MAIYLIRIEVREKGFLPWFWSLFSHYWEYEVGDKNSLEPEIEAKALRAIERKFDGNSKPLATTDADAEGVFTQR